MPSFAGRRAAATRATIVIGSLAALAAITVAPSFVSHVAAASHSVRITDSAFGPNVLTVGVGDTVTWTNADDRPHTVTSGDGSFDSGNIDEGGTFSFTFTAPGTFAYVCQYHPDMTATIIVQAPSGSQSGGPPSTQAAGGGTAGTAQPGTARTGADQPDTAVAPASGPIPAASYLLWGAGLLLLAIRFVPMWARRKVLTTRPSGGWRR